MLAALCCKATEVAKDTEVLVSRAKDAAKGAANEFTQNRLKDALIGEPLNQVHETPDVFVMIKDVTLKEGIEFKGLNNFMLRSVDCKVWVKVQGTKTQMAGMVAAQQAGKLFDFMSQGEKSITGALGLAERGLADKASATTAEAAAGLKETAATSDDFTELEFGVILDLEKVAGVEEVKAIVTSVTSDVEAINKIMSVDMMKTYVETAVSARASRIITDWQNQTFTLDNAKSKGGVLIASGVSKGGELLETGKAKGSELVDTAKVGDLLESGKAKGTELIETVKAKAGKQ